MADETDFLNDALGQIGATPITSIDDGSPNADHCGVFWPTLRRAMIRSHNWNFAVSRAVLAVNPVAPAFEFTFSYALPSDYLKVLEYNGSQATVADPTMLQLYPLQQRYTVEGKSLLTNDAAVFIVFLKDITNPDLWDPLFYQAASSWLASKLASAIQKSEKTATMKLKEAMEVFLPLAMGVDGQEGTVYAQTVDDLLRVR